MAEKYPKAFPSPDWNGEWRGPLAHHGMSQLEWYAGQALASIPADLYARMAQYRPINRHGDERDTLAGQLADHAFNVADAMMAEAERRRARP